MNLPWPMRRRCVPIAVPYEPRPTLACAALTVAFALTPAWPVEIVLGPTLTLDPNAVTPLAGSIDLETDVPTDLTLLISDGEQDRAVRFPDAATHHSVLLLGLKPDASHSITVRVTDGFGNSVEAESPLLVTTDPLPLDFPTIDLLVTDPDRLEPGFVLLDRIKPPPGDPALPYSMILDSAGGVVWYSTLGGSPLLQREDGRLMYLSGGQNKVEIDLLGNVDVLTLQDPGFGLHHDLFPTAHGTFLSLSREPFFVEGYPASYSDPFLTQDAEIQDSPVVEFDAAGSVVNVWRLTDLLDVHRIGFGSLQPNAHPYGLDWAHGNTAVYHPADDSITVSVRHQDASFKFSRATGELIWILAPHANWSPEFHSFLLSPVGTPFEWPYHQHSHMLTSNGTLLLFDNGNYRASPFDGTLPLSDSETYSRAVEFLIDEQNRTITQVWEWQPPYHERLYSPAGSDADWLPQTGHVLVHFRGVTHEGGFPVEEHARVVEVTHETPATVLFDAKIRRPGAQIRISRAEKIASLYPSDVSVCGNGVLDPADQCEPPGPLAVCDCCQAHGTPGCTESTCETAICAAHPSCCDLAWDAACATSALGDPQCLSCCSPRQLCTDDCRLDTDGDGIADDYDACLSAPSSGGGSAIFGQPVFARRGKDGFAWPHGADFAYAWGRFATSFDIGAYVEDGTGTGSGVRWIDPTPPAESGSGQWYLFRPDCADATWYSDGPSEIDCTAPSDCCVSNGTPGCGDAICESAVCASDPLCCNTDWDVDCAAAANLLPTCINGCNGTLCRDPSLP